MPYRRWGRVMDTLMKLFWLSACRSTKGQGTGHIQWSDELLAQVDKQYAAWERLYARVVSNNTKLGTLEMVRYSKEERTQLAIFVQNMEQFAPVMSGERERKITELHRATVEALRLYDNFFLSAN